jgi:GAF domain-containing protein
MTMFKPDNYQPENLEEKGSTKRSAAGAFFGRFIDPPDSIKNVTARRTAQLTAVISILLVIVLIGGIFAVRGFQNINNPTIVWQFVIAVSLIFAYFLSRTKYYFIGSIVAVISLAALGYGLVFLDPGLNELIFTGGIYATIPLSLLIGSVLLPMPWLILMTILNFAIVALSPFIAPVISFQRAGAVSGSLLGIGIILVITVVFRNALERYRLSEVNAINKHLNDAVQELNTNREMLEGRVAERTSDLQRRTRQIEAASEVSHVATSILDSNELMQKVVEMIRKSFDLYYVGLFLVDERYEWVILRAGTGEAGQLMLARGHRIRVGEGMVGWCVANSKARVTSETREDAVRRPSMELPDTRSEAALPLISRNRVFGAITVQSDMVGVFDQDMLVILRAMADQIAVALDNAHLYTESQEAILALKRSYGELSRQAWADALRAQPVIGFGSDPYGVYSIQTSEEEDAVQPEEQILKIPIKVRDQVLGSIHAKKEKDGESWGKDEVELLGTLVDQLSIAIENARLYEDTQRRAERERIASEISARIRESLDVDTVLQTAVAEMRRALNLDEITIRLGEGNGQKSS